MSMPTGQQCDGTAPWRETVGVESFSVTDGLGFVG